MKLKSLPYLLLLSVFSFSVCAGNPAKVSAVIPVKFKSKGLHAPVPYSQQLMAKGYTRVPTMNLPFTFSGGSKFNPTTVSKRSLARSLGNAAGNLSRLSPAGKLALAAYGAYELNCMSGSYPAMCFDQAWTGDTPPDGATSAPTVKSSGTLCGGYAASGPEPTFTIKGNATASDCAEGSVSRYGSARLAAYNSGRQCPSKIVPSGIKNALYIQDYNGTVECFPNGSPFFLQVPFRVIGPTEHEECPPTGPAWTGHTKMATVTVNGTTSKRCFQPVVPSVVTPDWVEDKIDSNPAPIGDLDLTDFVDPTTGAPDPSLFDSPTVDDVSPAFREAAEAAARGTLQSSNPNAEGYVPPDIHQEFLVQLNNWYEGNTFTDVFTNKPVVPDAPAPEPVKTDWTDFPGITQKQYEASNNAWAQSAISQAPNIGEELAKVDSEFTKLTDEISNVPTSLPYADINLAALVLFPSGGCSGFTVDVTLAGQPKTISVDKHCPPYDAWGRPFIEWILSILTILQIFHVFRRTLEVA